MQLVTQLSTFITIVHGKFFATILIFPAYNSALYLANFSSFPLRLEAHLSYALLAFSYMTRRKVVLGTVSVGSLLIAKDVSLL
jgi:hypothetical protein